jgi:hypothetical protein
MPAPAPARSAPSDSQPGRLQAGPAAVQLNAPAPNPTVIQASGGEPLTPNVRRNLERSFGVDLRSVRVHTDERAQNTARSMDARAFTLGTNVFLGPGARPTDLRLLAHEVAHVVQQRSAPAVQRWSFASGDHYEREAQQAAAAAVQHQSFAVRERTTPQPQRLGLSDILDGLADLAANLPGFTLLTVIIGRNPINLRVVERNFVNLLRGFMGLIPGGEILFQILSSYGVVARIGNWVSEQVAALGLNYEYIRGRFTAFTDSLSWTDIFSPGDVWRRARDIFTEPITRIRNFIAQLISQAITWLKETFMQPLSDFCREIPGYTLVTVLLGRDPFTNAAVPRTALNVVRAFAEFIPGGTEKVNQLIESRALERAYQWFIQETQARNLTWDRVTGTFSQAWNSLQLEDVLHPIDTLRRIVTLFRPLMSDLISFAGAALLKLLELIFEAVMGAGGARILAILQRARATFLTIIQNPVGFLRNLLGAVGQGIRQFMTNILRHLRDGVIAWLTGPVAAAGIQMPEQWDLRGIIWFVLQILGLTWNRIRQKLVRLMGERVVAMLETGFQLIQEVREKGLVQALRDRVTEFFGQLREAALGGIRTFIQQRLVMAGIQQLLSLLSPVGAVIQAIIKTYTTIQFFIQKINQIMDMVESIVDSIAAIAAGSIGAAANFIERTMARTIPIILDFLARFIGLGDVGAQVQNTIRNLQARVDGMLDRAVDWIRRQAASLASRALGGDPNAAPQQRLQNGLNEATTAINRLSGNRIGIALIRPLLGAIRIRNRMQSLEAVAAGGRWKVRGVVNPTDERTTEKLVEEGTGYREFTTRITYHPADSRRGGTKMVASPLGPDHPQGSRPSDAGAPPIWQNVNQRRNGRRLYVLGHLLNQQLGGTGADMRNLTPITFSANATHHARVEGQLKDLVNTTRRDRARWVHYEVQIQYPATRVSTPADVNEDEGWLASYIQAKWHLLKPKEDDPTQLVQDGSEHAIEPVQNVPPFPQT